LFEAVNIIFLVCYFQHRIFASKANEKQASVRGMPHLKKKHVVILK